MLVEKRLNRAHGVRSWLGASVVTVLLLCVFAAPISAASAATNLSGATVSPRSGTPSTTVVITVTYRNNKGASPDRVTAKIGSVERAMTGPATGDWRKGVVFRWSGKLSAGTYPVTISAQASRNRGNASLGAGSVTITPRPCRDSQADSQADPQADAEADAEADPEAGPAGDPTSDAETDEDAEAGRRADPRIAGRTRPATDARTDPHAQDPPDRDRDRPPDHRGTRRYRRHRRYERPR